MAKPPHLDRYERPEMPFERGPSPLLKAGRLAGAGLEFGLSVVLFFAGGKALDDYWVVTDPWMTIVGMMLGVAVGTWLLVRPFLGERRSGDKTPGASGTDAARDDADSG